MVLLTPDELEEMERLLAGLLDNAINEHERTAILQIHGRLTRIFESQSLLRASETRLAALTEQTSR